jgi:hypothetical protein
MNKNLSKIVSLAALLVGVSCLAMAADLAGTQRPLTAGQLAAGADLAVAPLAAVSSYGTAPELVLPYVAERRERALYMKMEERGTTVTNIRNRCEEDNLSTPQAVGRIMWLVKC